jgi:hypothetical protein
MRQPHTLRHQRHVLRKLRRVARGPTPECDHSSAGRTFRQGGFRRPAQV